MRSEPVKTTALIATLFGATSLVLGGCISSTTYGTGTSPGKALFGELGGGLIGGVAGRPKEKKQITYQERSPLVAPPSAQLPPPVESASADPNWPVETDRKKVVEGADEMTPEYVASLKPLAKLNRSDNRITGPLADPEDYHRDSMWQVVNSKQSRKQFSAALADAKGGPTTERRYLTDPPTEYLAPAESAQQDFEDIETKKKRGFFGRLFSGLRS